MAYSRDDSIKKIVDFKKQWEDANNAGDLVAKGNAEKYAKKVYEMMRANGDSDVADELSASDYTKAQQVQAKYNQITNNNPVADTVQQPVSSSVVSKENADVTEKYKKIFQTATEENPYETEVGKSIMGKFNLAAIQGRENQLASGAATNGGNIDSFSAANAMRQQAALVYQGQEAALAAQQQKIDNAQKILEGMGVHINRIFEQGETAKNNEVSRDVAISEATGYSTDNQLKSLSSMWNNGELVDTKTDYQARINEVKVLYDNATTDEEKQKYGLALKLLEMARNDKIAKTGSKESSTYNYQSLVPNSTTTLTREQIASAERIAQNESQSELDQINAQIQGEKEILGTQAALGLTGGNEDTPNQINTNDERFVNLVTEVEKATDKTPARYKPNNGDGVDYYGNEFIKLMLEWIDERRGGIINLDDENERAAFIGMIPTWSKKAHVNLGQLEKVMILSGVAGVIPVRELFENSSEPYERHDGAKWANGVVPKTKDNG